MPQQLLTHGDYAALIGYCQAFAEVRWAIADVEEHGRTYWTERGNLAKNPAVMILKDAMSRLRQFALEFGMTPASRSRVHAPPPAEEEDDLGKLLARSHTPPPVPPKS